jgi:hypothetical protein
MGRVFVLHVGFAGALAVIGMLAGTTALGTSGRWFSPEVSTAVYAASLIGATILASVLVATAAGLRARLDDSLRSLELRLASLPEAIDLPKDREATKEDLSAIPPSDEEVDDLLTVLQTAPPDSGIAELQVTGTLVEVSTALTAARTRRELLKAVVRQRTEVLAARRRIAPAIAGPIVACLAFAAIAGPMLPGVEAFASANFQLNTAAVLFLSYGWAVLVAWALAAIARLQAGPRRS